MARIRNSQGFTLLEIVISITILALMALMISRIFTESSRAVEQGKDKALLDETARLLLDNIEQDISQALVRSNVAFRVRSVSGGDSLYFISTGVRRKTETIPRDTAPMRLRTAHRISTENGLVRDLNRRVVIESASGSSGDDSEGNKDLIHQSDYYATGINPAPRSDFKTMSANNAEINKGESPYTESLEETVGVQSHASITFLDFNINGNPSSNRSRNALPDPTDMPRFVDVSLGLVTSKELQQAMRIHTGQGESAATDFIDNRERVYTRRIFMRNRGTDPLTF